MDASTSARDQLNQQIGRLVQMREWSTAVCVTQVILGSIYLGLGLAGLVSPETSGIGTVIFAVLALLAILYANIIRRRIRCKEAELFALLMEQNLKASPPSKGMVTGSKGVVVQTKQLPYTTRGGKEIGKSSGQMFRK